MLMALALALLTKGFQAEIAKDLHTPIAGCGLALGFDISESMPTPFIRAVPRQECCQEELSGFDFFFHFAVSSRVMGKPMGIDLSYLLLC